MDNRGKVLWVGVGGTGKRVIVNTLKWAIKEIEATKGIRIPRMIDASAIPHQPRFFIRPEQVVSPLKFTDSIRFTVKPILSTVKIEAKWEQVADELNKLYNGYVRTKDKSVLISITRIINSLDKSTLKKLKRYFRPKIKSFKKSTVFRQKKICSLILFITAYFSRVTGCEENNYTSFLQGKCILFSKQLNVVYVQQGRTNQIN